MVGRRRQAWPLGVVKHPRRRLATAVGAAGVAVGRRLRASLPTVVGRQRVHELLLSLLQALHLRHQQLRGALPLFADALLGHLGNGVGEAEDLAIPVADGGHQVATLVLPLPLRHGHGVCHSCGDEAASVGGRFRVQGRGVGSGGAAGGAGGGACRLCWTRVPSHTRLRIGVVQSLPAVPFLSRAPAIHTHARTRTRTHTHADT